MKIGVPLFSYVQRALDYLRIPTGRYHCTLYLLHAKVLPTHDSTLSTTILFAADRMLSAYPISRLVFLQ